MSDITCTNPDCPELDVPKTTGDIPEWLLPVLCGACGQPCTAAATADAAEG